MKAFAVIQSLPVVVPEYLFVQIPEQMERLDVDVCTLQSALEQAPEILQSVCVNLPVHVALCMVNRLVDEVLMIQSLIRQERVGVDCAFRFDVGANLCLQIMLTARRHNTGAKLSPAFENTHDSGFALYATVCNLLSTLIGVHETGRAADESLVHFYFFPVSAKSHKFFAVHRKANAVHHKPSRLLSDSESAGHFIGTDSVLAVHDEPYGNHPLVHAERGVLENGSDFDGELFLTALTEPDAPRRNKRVLRRSTARTINLASRPAQTHRIVKSLLRVREKANCFLQRLGKLN